MYPCTDKEKLTSNSWIRPSIWYTSLNSGSYFWLTSLSSRFSRSWVSRASLWNCTHKHTHRYTHRNEWALHIKMCVWVCMSAQLSCVSHLVVLLHLFEMVFLTDEQVQVLLPVSMDCLRVSLTDNNVCGISKSSNTCIYGLFVTLNLKVCVACLCLDLTQRNNSSSVVTVTMMVSGQSTVTTFSSHAPTLSYILLPPTSPSWVHGWSFTAMTFFPGWSEAISFSPSSFSLVTVASLDSRHLLMKFCWGETDVLS